MRQSYRKLQRILILIAEIKQPASVINYKNIVIDLCSGRELEFAKMLLKYSFIKNIAYDDDVRRKLKAFIRFLYGFGSESSHENVSSKEKYLPNRENCLRVVGAFHDFLCVYYGEEKKYDSTLAPIRDYIAIPKLIVEKMGLVLEIGKSLFVKERRGKIAYYIFSSDIDSISQCQRRDIDIINKLWEDNFEDPSNVIRQTENITGNNIYFCNVKEKYKKNRNIGEKLISDDIYLRNAINMLYKVIGTLFYEVQIAYNPKNEKWNKALSDMAFDLLCEKNYDVAEHLYFILSSCKQLCFRDKAMFRINYINALKQQGKDILVKKELEGLDVSIATDDYKIAKLCLEDRNEEVYKALNTNYPNVYSAELVRDWPIFINFRETNYYQKFIEEHSADADTIVVKFTEDGNEIQEN